MKNSIILFVCSLMMLLSCNRVNISELKFTGEPVAKTILQVSYNCKNSGVDHEIIWSIADSREGKWEELKGIHSKEIVLLSNYTGKYLKCEIIPEEKNVSKEKIVSIITDTPVVYKGNANTDWFKHAGVGVMLHFLKEVYIPEGGSKEWNDLVNGFDVELFAGDCKSAGAGFVMISLGQNDGYYCSPSATYDSIVGVKAGDLCSTRDLPTDLFNALDKRGIRMMLYLPGNPPRNNEMVDEKFQYTFGKDSPTSQFTQACWEAVIKEWSLRYAEKNSGWWFDGMYRGGIIEIRSDMNLAHNISTHTLAAKAGNSNSIVSYNHCPAKIESNSPYDDYSCGEQNQIGQLPENRWVADGIQWFHFTFLGKHWSGNGTRFETDKLTDWAEKVFEKEGVLCFDIHADKTGEISPEQKAQVKAVREKYEVLNKNIKR